MASEGPRSPGTVANDAGLGSTAWTNPGNAATENGVYATCTPGPFDSSQYLKATNFGFASVSGTVNGITVEVKRFASAGALIGTEYRLVIGGTVSGSNLAEGAWPGTLAYGTFGGVSNLWGLTPTAANILDSGFGFAMRCEDTDGFGEASVDHIRITVTYTPASGGGPLTESKLVGRPQLVRGLVR